MEKSELTAMTQGDGMELLLFELGDECYGIDILKVKEVIPRPGLTLVPHSHPAVSGVFQLRGAPLTVIDLAHAIGKGTQVQKELASVIVTEYLGERQGFLVSRVDRIIHCSGDDFHSAPPGAGESHFIEQVARVGETLIQALDMEKILSGVLPGSVAAAEVA